MTAALDALADDVLLDVFVRHSCDDWTAVDVRLDDFNADRCFCGAEGEGGECNSCTATWDAELARRTDV